MVILIEYNGKLKNNKNEIIDIIMEYSKLNKWEIIENSEKKFCVKINDISNSFLELNFDEKQKMSGYTEIFVDEEFDEQSAKTLLEKIFEVFCQTKKYYRNLQIYDEFGLWYEYLTKKESNNLPKLRELTEDERKELENAFYLPQGSNSIWGMEKITLNLMWMILKDINEDLKEPLNEEKILKMIPEEIKKMIPDESMKDFVFQALIIYWLVIKCECNDKRSNSKDKRYFPNYSYYTFSYIMMELGFNVSGCGNLNKEYVNTYKFIQYLEDKKYDLDDREISLRFIYSVMEYLKIKRPEYLIKRK